MLWIWQLEVQLLLWWYINRIKRVVASRSKKSLCSFIIKESSAPKMTDPTSDYWKCVRKDDLTEEVSFPDNFQYTYDMKERKKIAQEVLAAEVSPISVLQEFITHLPDNHAIHAGYHIPHTQKVSLCPCYLTKCASKPRAFSTSCFGCDSLTHCSNAR